MRCFPADPAVDDLAIQCGDGQFRAGQFFAADVGFVDGQLVQRLVGLGSGHDLPGNLRAGTGKADLDRRRVKPIALGAGDLHDLVIAAVVAGVPDTVRRFGLAACIGFAADGHIHIEPGGAGVIGGGAGGEQGAGIGQFVAGYVVDGVHRVEFIHGPGQWLAGLGVLFVDADADFIHQIFRCFRHGQHARVLEPDGAGLAGELLVAGVRGVDDVVTVNFVAVLGVVYNGLRQNHIVALVIPAKGHGVGLVRMYKAIRGLHLGDVVGAQRQGDRDLAGGAVVADGQEIVGGLGAGGAELDFVHLALFAGGHGGDQVAVGIPQRALAVAGGNVAVGADLVDRPGQVGLLILELAVLVTGQHIADLADGQLPQRLMVAVFFGDYVIIHIVGGVANDFPDSFAGQLKHDIVLFIVEEPFRPFHFDHTVAAERQFFGGFEIAVRIGIESRGFGGGVSGIGVGHFQQSFGAVRLNLVNLEGSVSNFDRLAGLCIDLDELQIPFQFLVQHSIGHVGIAGGSHAAIRLAHDTLRRGGVHRDHKRVGLEQVLGQRRFHDEVLAIG